MQRFNRHTSLALLFTAFSSLGALGSVGCSGDAGSGDYGAQHRGSVGLELELAPGVHVNTVGYEITGNGFTKSGSIDVTNSARIRAVIGGIPAGSGYGIRLTATEPGVSCEGSATFDVTPLATTTAIVSLRCRVTAKTGSVAVQGSTNLCPLIESLSAEPAEANVGGVIGLLAEASDLDEQPKALSFGWTSTGGALTANGESAELECEATGTFSVVVSVSDGDCTETAAVSVSCVDGPVEEEPTRAIRINEVESSGGSPGDWVELYNADTLAADLSGWVIRDNDDTHVSTLPSGTLLGPGAVYVVEEAALGFGLGGADSARLYDGEGKLVDSYSWTAHAGTTYGRCPDGSGPFSNQQSVTKGALNACTPPASTTAAWPGPDSVEAVDLANTYTSNLSGLTYQPALGAESSVLWAALNGPGTLYRLLFDGTAWVSDTENGWSAGKALRYPNGTGNPDTEGVTKAALDSPFLYVSTERNNDQSTVSRLSILRVDSSAAGAPLVASHEWNLTADLPVVGANLGLEAITFVPDAYLVANSFYDEAAGAPYQPSAYPDHAGGLFFVGVEGTGQIHAYALDHTSGSFVRVASIASGHPNVMGLEFDRDSGYLWAICDDTCGNLANVLTPDTTSSPFTGRFLVRRTFQRPPSLPNANNEGFAIAPNSECTDGSKSVFWSDDNNTSGHSLRRGSIPCAALF